MEWLCLFQNLFDYNNQYCKYQTMKNNQQFQHQMDAQSINFISTDEKSLEYGKIDNTILKNLKKGIIIQNRTIFESQPQLIQTAINQGSTMGKQEFLLATCKNQLDDLLESNNKIFSRTEANQKIQQLNFGVIFKEIDLICYIDKYLAQLKEKKPVLVKRFYFYCRQESLFYSFLQHLYYSNTLKIINLVFQFIFYIWQLYYPYRNCVKLADSQHANNILEKIASKIYDDQVKFRKNLARKGIPESQLQYLIHSLSKIVGSLMSRCLLCYFSDHFNVKSYENQQKDSQIDECYEKFNKKIKTSEQTQ